jgi:glycosyltransferase involved in cell wall biosynthesis
VLAGRLAGKPVMIRIMVDGSWEIAHRKGWIGGDGIDAYQGKSYGLKVAFVRALQKLWWSWCDHIISCSDYLRGILLRSYGVEPGKVQRVWNAHHGPRAEDVTITRADARQRLGVDPARPLVLTICRLMGWKRVDNILRALAELPADALLAVAGDGDMEQEWKALGRSLGLEGRVLWLGNVPHKDIPTWIRAADVFVLNSEYEGLSHTLVEVLHLGTPIVASRVCGNPEVVVDGVNGLLIDPLDHRTTRDAISKILSNKALAQQFAAAGMARRHDFDRESTFGEVSAALERLARAI